MSGGKAFQIPIQPLSPEMAAIALHWAKNTTVSVSSDPLSAGAVHLSLEAIKTGEHVVLQKSAVEELRTYRAAMKTTLALEPNPAIQPAPDDPENTPLSKF